MSIMKSNEEILKSAPAQAVAYSLYDYGDSTTGFYLDCENQFFDDEENSWVSMDLIDNYFHSTRRIQDIETIVKYEQWITSIADDHAQIPDWIQQSARSLLANSAA